MRRMASVIALLLTVVARQSLAQQTGLYIINTYITRYKKSYAATSMQTSLHIILFDLFVCHHLIKLVY